MQPCDDILFGGHPGDFDRGHRQMAEPGGAYNTRGAGILLSLSGACGNGNTALAQPALARTTRLQSREARNRLMLNYVQKHQAKWRPLWGTSNYE